MMRTISGTCYDLKGRIAKMYARYQGLDEDERVVPDVALWVTGMVVSSCAVWEVMDVFV